MFHSTKESAIQKIELAENGYTIIETIYDTTETDKILAVINQADKNKETFRKSTDLFAIRQFLKEVPQTVDLIFNHNLRSIIHNVFGSEYFVVKSIYFDKPGSSNWYVSYHQDLTISVNKKIEIAGFGPWTVKQQQFAVQPPRDILENIYTVRIHLDDTDENNGALSVISKSHSKGILRPETINWNIETASVCKVKKGGIMIMKPLLLHSSGRTSNKKRRRVIHIEFSNCKLPEEIMWAEHLSLKNEQFFSMT